VLIKTLKKIEESKSSTLLVDFEPNYTVYIDYGMEIQSKYRIDTKKEQFVDRGLHPAVTI